MIPDLFSYLLKLSLSLALVFLFYRLVLQNLTFYHWNRWYLLSLTALAFVIPLVDVSALLVRQEAVPVVYYIPQVDVITTSSLARPEMAAPGFNAWELLLGLILAGNGVLLMKSAAQFFSFVRIRRSARLISDQEIKIYQVDTDILPFSFGRSIFLNRALHREQDLQEIIRHEFVHVRQGHTFDVIWMELVCILNWYNPFAWLLRRHLRQNLEFIADSQVLQSGIDKKQYQYLLLQVTGGPAFHLGHQFNFSSLKKRIVMMNKMPSARPHLTKFLFLLPLLAVLLLAFRGAEEPVSLPGQEIKDRNTAKENQKNNQSGFPIKVNEKAFVNQVSPSDQQEAAKAKEQQKKEAAKGKAILAREKAKQQNETAKDQALAGKEKQKGKESAAEEIEVREKAEQIAAEVIEVREKAEQIAAEVIEVREKAEQIAAEVIEVREKAEQIAAEEIEVREKAEQIAAEVIEVREKAAFSKQKQADKKKEQGRDGTKGPIRLPDDYQLFMKRNPQVKGLQWRRENQGNKVIIHLRSGKQETYNLKDPASLAALEKKYGKLPAPPPAPPATPKLPPPPPVPADQQSPPPPPASPATPQVPPPPPPKGDNMGAYDTQKPNRLPKDYKAFLKRNPQVEKLLWYWGESLHNKPVQVVVIHKSGAQESYHFSSEAEMAGAERKYGKLPWPAPPVARYDVPPPVPARPEKPKGQK